jgi:hypothetical protein
MSTFCGFQAIKATEVKIQEDYLIAQFQKSQALTFQIT